MKPEISEEIISGWRREFDLEWTRVLVEWDIATDIIPQVKHSAWMIFLSAKNSSHERILEIQRESDNHNKSFLNMFEQNEEKAKRILELEMSLSQQGMWLEDRNAQLHIAEEKLTKRDELLREVIPEIEMRCRNQMSEWLQKAKEQLEQEK